MRARGSVKHRTDLLFFNRMSASVVSRVFERSCAGLSPLIPAVWAEDFRDFRWSTLVDSGIEHHNRPGPLPSEAVVHNDRHIPRV
jgi:hypothetical protein